MKRATPFLPRYRLDFKLRALAALDKNEGRVNQTARQLDIPRRTLSDWNNHREKIHREVERLREQRGITLEALLETVIAEIANTMLDKVEKAKLLDSMRGLKMLLDLSAEIAAKKAEQNVTRGDVHAKLIRLLDQYAEENNSDSTLSQSS